MTSLAEHADMLLALLATGWTVAGIMAWNRLGRIEKKQDTICASQAQCQADMPKTYVLVVPHSEEHQDIWRAINHHDHAEKGVVR